MEEYLDSRLQCRAMRQYGISDKEGHIFGPKVTVYELHEIIGEHDMAKLNDHIGDGNAKVTVGGDLALSNFGTKAGSFFSVTVACNNDMEDVCAVHDIVQPYVAEQTEKDTLAMLEILQRHISPEKPDGVSVPSKVVEPPKRTGPIFQR